MIVEYNFLTDIHKKYLFDLHKYLIEAEVEVLAIIHKSGSISYRNTWLTHRGHSESYIRKMCLQLVDKGLVIKKDNLQSIHPDFLERIEQILQS